MLAGLARSGSALQGGDGIIHRGQHGFPRTERIDGARLNEAFKHAFVQEARFDTFAEIVKGFELSLTQPRFTNRLGGVLANILDGSKTEANGFPDGREVEIALIHIGRENGNTHPARFIDVFHDFLGVAGFRGQERGHEFDGIMRFQISRLIGEQGVGTGV